MDVNPGAVGTRISKALEDYALTAPRPRPVLSEAEHIELRAQALARNLRTRRKVWERAKEINAEKEQGNE
ncbi:hypothetical protein [Actinotignum sp. GS-2025b]|uniref:hypothetical protein n=1 Tax=Actinotignum sp. GS-2025b TaxID=3427275 RepID=UPI003F47A02E